LLSECTLAARQHTYQTIVVLETVSESSAYNVRLFDSFDSLLMSYSSRLAEEAFFMPLSHVREVFILPVQCFVTELADRVNIKLRVGGRSGSVLRSKSTGGRKMK